MIDTLIHQVNNLAYESAKQGNDPFAALLVKDNKVVATSIDLSVKDSDPTAHAELNLIRQFCQKNDLISLEDYTLVSSTEPCVMCSGAIHWSRISKVIFSVSQTRLKKASSGNKKPTCSEIVNKGKNKIEVIGPVLEEEGYKVFQDFPLIPKIERHKVKARKEEPECLFCHHTLEKLIETAYSYSTLNFSPATPGHFLVTSKEHYTKLSEIRGPVQEDLLLTVEKTYEHIKALISSESNFLKEFYSELLRDPPFLYTDDYSRENLQYIEMILNQCHELNEPIGYNVGLNMNEGAGQRAAHIHYHVFPRYKNGLGVVNGMRCLMRHGEYIKIKD